MIDFIINPMFLTILSSLASTELILNKILVKSYETGSFYHGFRNVISIMISTGLAAITPDLSIIDIIVVFLSALTLAILIAVAYSLSATKGDTLLIASAVSFIVSLVSFIIGVAVGLTLLIIYPKLRRTKSIIFRGQKLMEVLASLKVLLPTGTINVTLMTLLTLGILV
ncbi:MAG: hypothetical protein NDP22_01805 [Crenarchaeota archaeon]|nr:hypothetical protein [Thermoproteota archaeon]